MAALGISLLAAILLTTGGTDSGYGTSGGGASWGSTSSTTSPDGACSPGSAAAFVTPSADAEVLSPVAVELSAAWCHCDAGECYEELPTAVMLRVDTRIVETCDWAQCPDDLTWSVPLARGKHSLQAFVEYGPDTVASERIHVVVTGSDARGCSTNPRPSSLGLVILPLLAGLRRRARVASPTESAAADRAR